MPQRNDLAEKKRVEFDGVEVPGLVNIAEVPLEKGQLEVPEFSRIRKIQNGISTIPAVEAVYKIAKDTNTLEFFRTWYFEDEVKDVTITEPMRQG